MSILQWRHNGSDGVSNHQRLDCLLNCFFRRRSKKTSKPRVAGLYEGNSPVTGEFPSSAENVSISFLTFILLYENNCILIQNFMKIVHEGPINKKTALVEIMVWRLTGTKPLSEPMVHSLLTHICVTRPQWVLTFQVPVQYCIYESHTWSWVSDARQWADTMITVDRIRYDLGVIFDDQTWVHFLWHLSVKVPKLDWNQTDVARIAWQSSTDRLYNRLTSRPEKNKKKTWPTFLPTTFSNIFSWIK